MLRPLVLALIALGPWLPPIASGQNPSPEDQLFGLINAERAKAGVAPLARNARLDELASEWARRMAAESSQFHRELTRGLLDENGWKNLSENIYGPTDEGSPRSILRAWLDSPGHRGNLMRESSSLGGVGIARTRSGEVCAVFNGACPKPAAPRESAPSSASPVGAWSPASIPAAMGDSSVAFPSKSDGRKLHRLNQTNE